MWKFILSKQFDQFNKLTDLALEGGGSKRLAAQKDKGKLTARERIDLLFDEYNAIARASIGSASLLILSADLNFDIASSKLLNSYKMRPSLLIDCQNCELIL